MQGENFENKQSQESQEKNVESWNLKKLDNSETAKKTTESIQKAPEDEAKLHEIINKDVKKEVIWQFDSTKDNINSEKKTNGYEKISIIDKTLSPRSEPEVAVTIKPDWKINVHINPYSKYDKYYFSAENLSADQFIKEKWNIENIRKDIAPDNTTVFKKKQTDIDPNDYI